MNLHTWFGIAVSVAALSVATPSSRQESSSEVTVLWQFETGG
jgi:hypothetical protein